VGFYGFCRWVSLQKLALCKYSYLIMWVSSPSNVSPKIVTSLLCHSGCLMVSLWIQLSASSMLSISKSVNSLTIVDQFRMWCITLEKDQQKWLGHNDWFAIFVGSWYQMIWYSSQEMFQVMRHQMAQYVSFLEPLLKSLCVWEMSAVLTENSRCCGFSGVYNLNHDVLKYSSTTSLTSQTK
jgi:hypothetical protein